MHHRAAYRASRMAAAAASLALFVALLVSSPKPAAAAFETVQIASGLSSPIYATGINYPDLGELVYIVQQNGIIRVMVDGVLQATPFLNIDPRVLSGGERGLLGFALHPDFVTNGEFIVHYSWDDPANTGDGDTRIARFGLVGGNPLDGDEDSEEVLLTEDQPFSNHNGGWIAFGPNDGYLYISLGDGGSGGDPGNRSQNGATILGKMLRIDVDNGTPYAIPPDNPFADPGDGFRDEIWAYGLRNAWRNGFDRATGDLWIGDVGQDEWEEIDFEPANTGGRNYGWRRMEGLDCYNPSSGCNDGSLTLPIHVYSHAVGFSVTGGHVHRDPSVPELNGLYIFADYGSGRIWSLSHDGSGGSVVVTERTSEFSPSQEGFTINTVASFGEGPNGELYLCDIGGQVYQVVGDPADTGDVEPAPISSLRLDLASANPFTPASPLQFAVSLPESGSLDIAVIDAAGRAVRSLVNGEENAGRKHYVWNGRTDGGDFAASGVYFLRAVTDRQVATQKVGFLR